MKKVKVRYSFNEGSYFGSGSGFSGFDYVDGKSVVENRKVLGEYADNGFASWDLVEAEVPEDSIYESSSNPGSSWSCKVSDLAVGQEIVPTRGNGYLKRLS